MSWTSVSLSLLRLSGRWWWLWLWLWCLVRTLCIRRQRLQCLLERPSEKREKKAKEEVRTIPMSPNRRPIPVHRVPLPSVSVRMMMPRQHPLHKAKRMRPRPVPRPPRAALPHARHRVWSDVPRERERAVLGLRCVCCVRCRRCVCCVCCGWMWLR